jgi:hypothetical protein
MDKQTKDVIIYGAGAIIAIVFANKILTALGLKQSPEQTKGTTDPIYNPNTPSQTKYKYSYSQSIYNDIVDNIHSSFNYFGLNAFNYVITEIKKLKTKGDVHAIVVTFPQKYNIDLYEFLKTGGGILPWDGLSNNELAQINNYVNSLP